MTANDDSNRKRTATRWGVPFDEVYTDELGCVRHRWQAAYPRQEETGQKDGGRKIVRQEPSTENELVGLAFSGGGIRSATINMGIAQALHRRGVFDHVDYMSTVSGGGYLGSSISTAMRELPGPDDEDAPRNKGEFPYAYKEPGAETGESADDKVDVESKFLTWVRNNSNYMATGGFLDWPRIFGVLLRGMLANFLVLLPILLALAVVLVWFHSDTLANWEAYDQEVVEARAEAARLTEEFEQAEKRAAGGDEPTRAAADAAQARADAAAERVKELEKKAPKISTFFLVAFSIAGFFLLLVLIFPVMIRVYKVYHHGEEEESSVKTRGNVEKAFGILLVLAVVAAAAEALPLLIRWFHKFETSGVRGLYTGAGSGGALAVFATAGKLLSKLGGLRQKIMLLLVGLLGLVIPLVVALYVADDLIYPVAGIEAAADTDLAKALAERPKAAVTSPTPAYEVKEWAHPPMELTNPFAGGGWVRLLPGALLIIMVGGLGAAGVGKILSRGKKEENEGEKSKADENKPGLAARIARRLFVAVGILVGAAIGYALLIASSQSLAALCGRMGFAGIRPDVLVLSMALVVLLFSWAAIDVNLTAVLGLYRDRLAAAYLIGRRKKKDGDGDEIFVEPDLNLEKLCGGISPDEKKWFPGERPAGETHRPVHASKAPYHIVNTALNLQGSKDPMLRDRGSDCFMFSKLYFGGKRTGYCETWRLEKVFPQMDLPTAMAISAAAASPNAGRMTSKPLVALMTLLNVRLGYWVPHPGRLYDWLKEQQIADPKLLHRWGWRVPSWALLREMNSGVNEEHKWVNLSDGGHIENMAVYELLRRRLKYIICGDGEADPTLTFGGLATLMRSARIDFGIEIEILLDDLRLGEDRRSSQHAALGKILYPSRHPQVRRKEAGTCPLCGGELADSAAEGSQETASSEVEAEERYRCPRGEIEIGYLLYIKSSFTGNEDETMQEYRAKNADFPHETTADQFFDEGQFEAYRALGFHMADGLFPPWVDAETSKIGWDGFRTWFHDLRADLAPRLSAKHAELQEQLRHIQETLVEPDYRDYYAELHPDLVGDEASGAGDPAKARPLTPEISYMVSQQLALMENAFVALNLDQPRNWQHEGNQGWRALFENWAQSDRFARAYEYLGHLHSGRFQNFCCRNFGLPDAGRLWDLEQKRQQKRAAARAKQKQTQQPC